MKNINNKLQKSFLLLCLALFIPLFAKSASKISFTTSEPDKTINVSLDKTSICKGETICISLSTSETGVEYELNANGNNIESPQNGTGSSINFSFAPAATAIYSITATNISTLESTELLQTVSVTVLEAPKLDLTITASDNEICESLNEPVIISIANSENECTYWLKDSKGKEISMANGNGGQMNFSSVSPDTTTSYFIETRKNTCSSKLQLTNTLNIEVIPLPITNIDLSISEPEICVGEKTIISLDTSEKGVSYQLFNGTYLEGESISGNGSQVSFPEFSPFRSLYYRVIASNNICGTSVHLNKSIRVDVGLQPEEHLHPTIDKHTICEGEEVTVSLTPSDPNVHYQLLANDIPIGEWVEGNSEEIKFEPTSPTSSTVYKIEALGKKCLAAVDIRYTVDVDVHHYPEKDKKILSDRDTICAGEEVSLFVENSQTDILYQLHNGTEFIEPSLLGNGGTIEFPAQIQNNSKTYKVYAHESVCGDPVLINDSKQISVPDLSPLSLETFATPYEICEGESIDIEIPNTLKGISYILQNGDDELSEITSNGNALVFENIIPDQNSNLQIRIGNCKEKLIVAKADYVLQTNPKLQIFTSEVQSGYDGNLAISVTNGKAPYTYIINPGETKVSEKSVLELNGLEAGTYEVLVIDDNACRSSESGEIAEITINEDLQVIVNNALTPNGDGINDNWLIHYNSDLSNPEVYIFNIYGQQIYHSKAYQNDWKGDYKGSILPNGAYYYLIEFESDEIKPIKGSLSILGNY
nr:gliding motility-associated C-terminal domain-containing protein [uncultured Marinifilum sp.]